MRFQNVFSETPVHAFLKQTQANQKINPSINLHIRHLLNGHPSQEWRSVWKVLTKSNYFCVRFFDYYHLNVIRVLFILSAIIIDATYMETRSRFLWNSLIVSNAAYGIMRCWTKLHIVFFLFFVDEARFTCFEENLCSTRSRRCLSNLNLTSWQGCT